MSITCPRSVLTRRRPILAFSLLFPLSVATAQSSLPVWQVVAGEHSQVAVAGWPSGVSRDLRAARLADRGRGWIGVHVANPAQERGYWLRHNGVWQRYAQPDTHGPGGPGRSGGESNHQFLEFPEFSGDAGPDAQRLVRARAGDPAQVASASYGLWRWTGAQNVEVARGGTDGVLGPGLGSGWRFENAADLAWGRMLDQGVALLHGGVRDEAGNPARLVALHVPGLGNQPCLRSGAAPAHLRPGLSPNDQFNAFTDSTLERIVSTADGRIYAHLPVSGVGGALFQICAGAPRVLAMDDGSGPLGPDVGLPDARFVSLSSPRPGSAGALYFRATWRIPNLSQPGLFRHDGNSNRGIAYNELSGFHGPNWESATWHSFNGDSLSVAEHWLAFSAELANAGTGNPRGLWRLRQGERPQILALVHATAAIGEAQPGRRWRSFLDFAVLANGDVVLHAMTDPGPRTDLWLLSPGRQPRRWLSAGDTVSVPTEAGPVSATITGYTLAASGPGMGGGRNPEIGADGWVAVDGSLLLRATTTQHGDLLLSTRIDVERLFADGFE